MRSGSSPAARALARAQAAARYARETGCDIGEATSAVAESGADPADRGRPGRAEAGDGLSRRQVLRGAAGAGLAVAVPAGALARSAAARAALRPDPRVVIIGSGIAGLGCAFRLARHGIPSEVYEYSPVRAGGRIHTLRGFFAAGQYTEEHGEFISSEHTGMRHLAAGLGLTLDNVNAYPPHTRAADYRFRFDGRFWPQAALDREWHDWGFRLFHDAAFVKAPWPTLYNRHNRHTAWAYAWSAGDPHIGGAYSYLRTGQYTAFNGIQGRRSGNLHFAGEHTSVDFQGYMEGALRSGYRCAAEITRRRTA